jgi:hypothetical protein
MTPCRKIKIPYLILLFRGSLLLKGQEYEIKNIRHKKTNIYENYLSEKRFNNFAGKMMKNLPFTRPPCTIGVFNRRKKNNDFIKLNRVNPWSNQTSE